MEEIRITIDGKQVTINTCLSKKKLLEILDKARLNVQLSIAKEKEDEFTGTRWKVIDDNSPYYHQMLTVQSINNDLIYFKYDLDDSLIKCSVDQLTGFARMVDE